MATEEWDYRFDSKATDRPGGMFRFSLQGRRLTIEHFTKPEFGFRTGPESVPVGIDAIGFEVIVDGKAFIIPVHEMGTKSRADFVLPHAATQVTVTPYSTDKIGVVADTDALVLQGKAGVGAARPASDGDASPEKHVLLWSEQTAKPRVSSEPVASLPFEAIDGRTRYFGFVDVSFDAESSELILRHRANIAMALSGPRLSSPQFPIKVHVKLDGAREAFDVELTPEAFENGEARWRIPHNADVVAMAKSIYIRPHRVENARFLKLSERIATRATAGCGGAFN